MSITTQILGKTSAIKGGLFRIKERLGVLGVKVTHPLGDRIILRGGTAYIYNPDEWSEYEVLLDACESIRDSGLHIVSNDVGGIIGRESTLSIAYAMLHDRPVIITHKPYFRGNVDQALIAIIQRNHKQLNFQNLLKLNNADLKPYVELVATQKPLYRLAKSEKTYIQRSVRDYLRRLLEKSATSQHRGPSA